MKRLSRAQKEQLERLRLRHLDYCRRKSRRAKRLRRDASSDAASTAFRIQAPSHFFLYDKTSHDSLLEFLEKLRWAITLTNKKVLVDFSNTVKMVAGGTLLFFAELDRLHRAYPHRFPLRCIAPRNDTVGQVLTHLGILRLIQCKEAFVPDRDDVVQWRYASGVTVDAATHAGPVLDQTSGISTDLLPLVFRGVSEAMTNVSHHAYYRPRLDGFTVKSDRRWWMFCRQEGDRVAVGFCDLGLGIPVTLRENENWGTLKGILRSFHAVLRGGIPRDGDMIKAAVVLKQTRTKLPNQGKGLTDVLKAVEQSKSGYLAIYSNSGCYTKRYDITETEHVRNYRRSIYGTLIFWSLPIPKTPAAGKHP